MPVTATPYSSSSATGRYAAQSDIESQFGVDNIAAWSQLDNSVTTADTARIQTSLDYADAKIISTFAGFGNYAIPLAPLGSDVNLVTRWAAIISGCWLYQTRGLRNTDPQGNQISQFLAEVNAEMLRYRSTEKLNAARRWPAPTAPVGY